MMKILKFAVWVIILLAGAGAAALATVGWQLGSFDAASSGVLIGAPMPEFKLKSFDGAAQAPGALLAGKPLPGTQTKAWGCTIKRAE